MPADKHASVLVNCPCHLILTKTGMSQHVTETPEILWKSIKQSLDRHWKENMCILVTLLAMWGKKKNILVSCASHDHNGIDRCKIFLHTNYYQLCFETCANCFWSIFML